MQNAENSTLYNADKNIEFVVNDLEHSSSILFKWLNDIYIKVTPSMKPTLTGWGGLSD